MSLDVTASTAGPSLTTTNTSMYGASAVWLQAAWVYPTTFTAGTFLWSDSTNPGCLLVGTSEVRYRLKSSSSSPIWTSSTAGIVTNKWQFIAIVATTGSVVGTKTVKGVIYDDVLGWRDMGFSQTTAGSGSWSYINVHTFGNGSSGTLPMPGLVDQYAFIYQPTVNGRGWLPVNTAGTITTDEFEGILANVIKPMCYGTLRLRDANAGASANNLIAGSLHCRSTHYLACWRDDSELTLGLREVDTIYAAADGTGTQDRAPFTLPMTWLNG